MTSTTNENNLQAEMEHITSKIKCLKGDIDKGSLSEGVVESHKKKIKVLEQELTNLKEAELPFDLLVANKYKQLYNSASKRNKEFTLTLQDVRKLLKRKTCQYTGVKFGEGDLCRSIDRFDSSVGYTKENCFAVTKRINDIKNHLLEREDSTLGISFKDLKKFVEVMSVMKFGGK